MTASLATKIAIRDDHWGHELWSVVHLGYAITHPHGTIEHHDIDGRTARAIATVVVGPDGEHGRITPRAFDEDGYDPATEVPPSFPAIIAAAVAVHGNPGRWVVLESGWTRGDAYALTVCREARR